MNRSYELTPRERLGLFLIDERPDRVPLLPLITSYASRSAGITVREYCTDGRLMARAHLAAWKRFNHDALMVFSDVGMVAEALGSEYYYPTDSPPELSHPVLTDSRKADELTLPNVETPGRWGVYYQAIEQLFNLVGDRVPILALVPAPFTTAAGICGVEGILVDLITDPEAVLRVLNIITEAVIRLLDGVMARGALPVLVDPLASGSVISAEQFRTFAQPGLMEAIRFLHRYDMDVLLHICGRAGRILDEIPATGCDLFSLDELSLAEARNRVGREIRLVGNISPAALMRWQPAEVAAAVAQALHEGKDNPKGLALATGCEVALETPPENLEAFMWTGSEIGKYEN
ncbi:MAG: uroporphyrinogen decarboxylase family protein [Calditrichota bacterium]